MSEISNVTIDKMNRYEDRLRAEGAAAERRRLRRALIRATQMHGYSIDVFTAMDKATLAPRNVTKRSDNKLRKDTK